MDPKTLRQHILYMAHSGQSVHVACAFSIVELVSVLYGGVLKLDPKNPKDPNRDYFLLSKGHGIMAVYAAFRELGWVTQGELGAYFSDGSRLHGLSEDHVDGVEVTSGSLGHGLPVAVGIALGLKRLGRTQQQVYCVIGDGEANEGSIWEALLFAQHHALNNLTVIVDANGHQAMGTIDSILKLEPFADKFRAFGFETRECDGHDVNAIRSALDDLKTTTKRTPRPQALIARTVKGHGVSFMANDNRWHYLRLDDESYARALGELKGTSS